MRNKIIEVTYQGRVEVNGVPVSAHFQAEDGRSYSVSWKTYVTLHKPEITQVGEEYLTGKKGHTKRQASGKALLTVCGIAAENILK